MGLDANQPTGGLDLWESKGTVTGNAPVEDINPGTAGSTRRFLTRRQRRWCALVAKQLLNGAHTDSPACVTAAVRASLGEVRNGEVLSLLKGWNAGHPGGVCTVHANHARAGLRRIEQLIAEVSQTPMRALIA
jgi:ELWxxDGT repeat protein